MTVVERLSRRRLLRGAIAGSGAVVALPLLDCFLDGNGTALANGAPVPTRYATWFWGLGFKPGRYEPKNTGSMVGQDLGPEAVALEAIKDKINIFTMFKVFLDGRPNAPHAAGWHGQLAGRVPAIGEVLRQPTLDTLIADAIGGRSRFRSLEVSCTGSPRASYSYRAGGVQQPSETSPAQLYARIFGNGFVDPNGAEFKPDPAVMAQRSVLSAVKEEREAFVRDLGAVDRARLDEYFTSLRQLEQQVALQLEKPAPMEACTVLDPIEETKTGEEIEVSLATNKLMSKLLAHALACGQTRVANLVFSTSASGLRIPGDATTHHTDSHTEAADPSVGYQKKVSYLTTRSMEGLRDFIQILDSFKEGDRTLLDNMLVLGTSDCGDANTHSMENIPVITAGRGGGVFKTGLHVSGVGEPATRVGLTVMQALKVPMSTFGADSNETSKTVTEVLV